VVAPLLEQQEILAASVARQPFPEEVLTLEPRPAPLGDPFAYLAPGPSTRPVS